MKRYKIMLLSLLIMVFLTTFVYASGYMKLGDIKGESTRESGDYNHAQRVENGNTSQTTGLLLPGIQKAPRRMHDENEEGMDDSSERKGNVKNEWKVEKGE
jgi:hypothetical protein